MKNKIKSIFTILIVCMAFSSISVFAVEDDFSTLGITLLNQNPDPVYAGDMVEVAISLTNAGYGTLDTDNVKLEIESEFPFTVISDDEIELSKIFSSNDYIHTEKIKLKVDSSAQAGDYELVIKEIRGSIVTEHKLTISVASNKNIEIVSIDKSTIKPGDIEEITFKIKNVGSTNLRNIEFFWENNDVILLPVNGDNKFFIDSLNIGEEKEVPFTISASSAASADLYKIDITLSYENTETSETTQETSNTGIYVGGETEFDLTFDEESDSEYIFTITNIGANDAESVKVSVDESSEWQVLSKASEIIGSLNTGDYTTISYEFARTQGDLKLRVDYTDTAGKRISTIQDVDININTNANLNSSFAQRGEMAGNFENKAGQRNNPMSGLQTGVTKLKTWAIYGGYGLLVLLVCFVGLRVYKKTVGKKRRNK